MLECVANNKHVTLVVIQSGGTKIYLNLGLIGQNFSQGVEVW